MKSNFCCFVIAIFCAAFFAAPVYAIEEINPQVEETSLQAEVIDLQIEQESFTKRLMERLIEEPKTLKIEKGFVDDFTVGLLYQGTMDMGFDEENTSLSTRYPLFFEVWTRMKMEDGKSELRFAFVPTRDVDGFDKKFAAYLGDVYYRRELKKGHSVLFGNSRTPIGIEGAASQGNLLFVKRSQLTNAFGNARSPGVRFQGDFGLVDYDLGGYLSTRSLQELGDGVEMVNWVNVKPFYNQEGSVFRTLKLGGGLNFGHRKGDYTVAGVGGSWNYKKLLANFELANANGSNAKDYSPKRSQGLYTTVGYNFTDKWQLLGRYDLFDPDTGKSDNLKTQYTAGLNYYVMQQRLRFSLNYCFETNETTKNDKNAIYFMTQIML